MYTVTRAGRVESVRGCARRDRREGRRRERRLTDLPGLDRSPLVSLDPDGDEPHGGKDGAGLKERKIKVRHENERTRREGREGNER